MNQGLPLPVIIDEQGPDLSSDNTQLTYWIKYTEQ